MVYVSCRSATTSLCCFTSVSWSFKHTMHFQHCWYKRHIPSEQVEGVVQSILKWCLSGEMEKCFHFIGRRFLFLCRMDERPVERQHLCSSHANVRGFPFLQGLERGSVQSIFIFQDIAAGFWPIFNLIYLIFRFLPLLP